MDEIKIYRLNYIGSKFKLLNWIEECITEFTGIKDFSNLRIADIFSGTGIVSSYFKEKNAIIFSNDSEIYSSIIVNSMINSYYNEKVSNLIELFNSEISGKKSPEKSPGFITKNYSPYQGNERKFFTEENAKIIDYLRNRIEESKDKLTYEEYIFLLASLIVSSDSVSNVPAVYGCFLKEFKAKALKKLNLNPIHNIKASETIQKNFITNLDVLSEEFKINLSNFGPNIVYLDPPYNERQYSKNYFPLNVIALSPEFQEKEILKGKTGIPESCFVSDFCKKKNVKQAFVKLFETLKYSKNSDISEFSKVSKFPLYVFLSYNSESLISKDSLIELLTSYGEVVVKEKDYKRFKSFDYNQDKDIQEYLFCIKMF
jgi:adenine-specific DNA-methyltransferase